MQWYANRRVLPVIRTKIMGEKPQMMLMVIVSQVNYVGNFVGVDIGKGLFAGITECVSLAPRSVSYTVKQLLYRSGGELSVDVRMHEIVQLR